MKTIAAIITLVCSSAYGVTVQDLNVPGEGAVAYGINDKGQIVGTYFPDFGFLWQNGTGTSEFSLLPQAINNQGIMVGMGSTGAIQFWPVMKNLQTGITTPIPVQPCGNFNGWAAGISDSGYVTGSTCNQ